MRKLFNFFAAALVMLAAASCEKNEVLPDNNSEGKVVILNASINNGGTKTSLGQGVGDPIQYPVYWSEGDAIAVIQGSNVYEFTLKTGAGKTSATFQSTSAKNFDPENPYKAFYPFSYVSVVDSKIKYTIPDTQRYAENSFGVESVPMVAECSTPNGVLDFTSLSGALKLQFTGNKIIRSIEVVASNVNISGEISSANPYSPSLTDILFDSNNGNRSVTLDCGQDGVQLRGNTATDFIIAISKYNGLSLTIIVTDTEDNKRVLRIGGKQNMSAGNIIKMPLVNYDEQPNDYIVVENTKGLIMALV